MERKGLTYVEVEEAIGNKELSVEFGRRGNNVTMKIAQYNAPDEEEGIGIEDLF